MSWLSALNILVAFFTGFFGTQALIARDWLWFGFFLIVAILNLVAGYMYL